MFSILRIFLSSLLLAIVSTTSVVAQGPQIDNIDVYGYYTIHTYELSPKFDPDITSYTIDMSEVDTAGYMTPYYLERDAQYGMYVFPSVPNNHSYTIDGDMEEIPVNGSRTITLTVSSNSDGRERVYEIKVYGPEADAQPDPVSPGLALSRSNDTTGYASNKSVDLPSYTSQSPAPVSWSSNNTGVAQIGTDISGNPVFKVEGTGTVTLTAQQSATQGYTSASADYTVTVSPGPSQVIVTPGNPYRITETGAVDITPSLQNGGADISIKLELPGTGWSDTVTQPVGDSRTFNNLPIQTLSPGDHVLRVSYAGSSLFDASVTEVTLEVVDDRDTLSALSHPGGVLSPSLGSQETSYTINVPASVDTFMPSFTTTSPAARVLTPSMGDSLPFGRSIHTLTVDPAYSLAASKDYTITVERARIDPGISYNAKALDALYTGAGQIIERVVSSTNPAPFNLTESTNPEVAIGLPNGEVGLMGPGTTTLTFGQAAADSYSEDSIQFEVTVEARDPGLVASAVQSSLAYSPGLTVQIQDDSASEGMITYQSSDPQVATVSPDGLVLFHKAGQVNVTVSQEASDPYKSATDAVELTVTRGDADLSIAGIPLPFTYTDGGTHQVEVTSSSPAPRTFASSDESVFTVSDTGLVELQSAGSATLTVSQPATDSFTAGQTQIDLEIMAGDANFAMPSFPRGFTYEEGLTQALPTPVSLSTGAVNYISSDPSVMTVDANGLMRFLKAGEATIIISQKATDAYASAELAAILTVAPGHAAVSIPKTPATFTYTAGGTYQMPAPESQSPAPFAFISSDEDVFTVSDSGLVEFQSAGTATLTVSQPATDSFTAGQTQIDLEIMAGNPDFAMPSFPRSFTYAEGLMESLPAPTSLSAGAVSYNSSDPSVMTVDTNGLMRFHAAGDVRLEITQAATDAYTASDIEASLTVLPGDASISIRDIPSSFTYTKDGTYQMPAPESRNPAPFAYSSSDPSVMTVDTSGVIRFLTAGQATITIAQEATRSYKAGTLDLTIDVVAGLSGLAWSSEAPIDLTLYEGSVTLPTTVSVSDGDVAFHSSDTDVFTVEAGQIVPRNAGTALLVATQQETLSYTSARIERSVSVAALETSITLSASGDVVEPGVSVDITARFSPETATGLVVFKAGDDEAHLVANRPEGTPVEIRNGQARFSYTPNADDAGSDVTIMAAYDGDRNHIGTRQSITLSVGSPASAFRQREEQIKGVAMREVEKAASAALRANQKLMTEAKGRFIQRRTMVSGVGALAEAASDQPLTFNGYLSTKGTSEGIAANGAGSFFQMSALGGGETQRVFFGDFDLTRDDTGTTTGSVSAKLAWEILVSEKTMIGRFVGADLAYADIDGTFKGDQSSLGVSAGAYAVHALKEDLFVDVFASLGIGRNQLTLADDVLSIDGTYTSYAVSTGATLTGTYPVGDPARGLEVWPQLSLAYSRTELGEIGFDAQAYGMSETVTLDAGHTSLLTLGFEPELRGPITDGPAFVRGGIATLAPKVMCERTGGFVDETSCGGGASIGMIKFNPEKRSRMEVSVGVERIGGLTRQKLSLKYEARF